MKYPVLSFLSVCLLLFTVSSVAQQREVAIFAGGCFWCMEPPYDEVDGVLSTTSGYIGGDAATATYKLVSSGRTAHVEVVKVEYDPAKVDYQTLLDIFWRNVDPFDKRGQFCDKGDQYKSHIYYRDSEQQRLAQASLDQVRGRFEQDIATTLVEAGEFFPAEDYHQDYYQKNPIRYKFYRTACGRDQRLQQIWGG